MSINSRQAFEGKSVSLEVAVSTLRLTFPHCYGRLGLETLSALYNHHNVAASEHRQLSISI